jgi:hypothetical protein
MASSPAGPQSQSQSQPTSILLRNRENQRASRARRKGYIEDLEKRLRQFERDGAAATVEVQSAARKVAEENFWLRHLLLSSYGIPKGEVDEYVERNRTHGQPLQSSTAKLPPVQRKRKHSEMSERELEAARTLGQIDSPKLHGPAVPWEVIQSPRVVREPFRDLPTPEDSNGNGSEQEHTTSTSPELREMADQPERYRPPVSAYPETHQGPRPQSCAYDVSNHPRQTDVTPCEEAAHIIASMRGHEDPDSVWPELGCSSDTKCTVKNMTIFQLGDVER